jgi:hypothetical protein
MDLIFVTFLAAGTSFFAYRATKKIQPSRSRSIRDAVSALLEWIGAFAFFLVANLALGVLVIFLIRGFTPQFVALYALENLLLLVLSAAQGFVFQLWWKGN